MGLKTYNPIELYQAGPEVIPSAQIDASLFAAARASPSAAPSRLRRQVFLIGAVAAGVVAVFVTRIATTPTEDFASTGNGLDEGLARAWLTDLDIQRPTGPGSQEGLP